MDFYINHGVDYKNLIKILETGILNRDEHGRTFFHLVLRNIYDEEIMKPYFGDICMVFSPSILKNNKFKLFDYMSNGESGVVTEKINKRSLEKIRKNINSHTREQKEVRDDPKTRDLSQFGLAFWFSHEIIIENEINIADYILAIVVPENKLGYAEKISQRKLNNIKKLSSEYDIPVLMMKSNGIDNFIDLVENGI